MALGFTLIIWPKTIFLPVQINKTEHLPGPAGRTSIFSPTFNQVKSIDACSLVDPNRVRQLSARPVSWNLSPGFSKTMIKTRFTRSKINYIYDVRCFSSTLKNGLNFNLGWICFGVFFELSGCSGFGLRLFLVWEYMDQIYTLHFWKIIVWGWT